MRTLLPALALAALLGAATSASADVGPGGSLQRAIMTARNFGMVGFSEIQYDDGKWELEGRDPRGKSMTMHIDGMTGALLKIDRY